MNYDTKQEINEIIEKQEEDEFLLEMAVVGQIRDKSRRFKYNVIVDSESDRVGEPYFKLFDKPNRIEAKQSLRVSFKEPKAIYHSDGYKPIPITKKLGEFINDFMRKPNKQFPEYTNWQFSIIMFNSQSGRVPSNTQFSKLTQKVIDRNPQKYKFCIPIDLPMPDYTLLQ